MSSIVVAVAGPLHYLILIDCAHTLETLFDRVLVPFAVRDELLHGSTPKKVKQWISSPKAWLHFEPVLSPQPITGLHAGEAEALQLALVSKADGVLMDDLDGRAAARQLGLLVIGTIGLLERAAEKGLIELPKALAQLRQTNIFISDSLFNDALERERQRIEKSKQDKDN